MVFGVNNFGDDFFGWRVNRQLNHSQCESYFYTNFMLFWRTSIVLESLTWLYSHTKYPLERVFLMDYELLDLELIFCLFNG